MDPLTIFGILVGTIGAIAGIIQVLQYLQEHREKHLRAGRTATRLKSNINKQILPNSPFSEVIGKFYLTREKIIAKVFSKYEPIYSDEISAAFTNINSKKKNGYFAGQRFRPITPPRVYDDVVELDLTPLNYAFIALMKDEETPSAIRQKVQEQISKAAKHLPKNLTSDNKHFNAHSYNLLGTVTCLVTSDGMTLLRKRGKSVLTGRNKWDVSVSGHPSPDDVIENQLDLARTVQRETQNEIGSISGDPRKIIFIGLHRNQTSGDVDILALWHIENTAKQLIELITHNRVKKEYTFETSIKARESYVWDTDNLLVEFNGPALIQAITKASVTLDDFLPESLACLELALLAEHQMPLGLGL